VEADLIRDVGNLVRVVNSLFLDLQRMDRGITTFRLVVDGFGKVASENFHDTVGIGMIVDQAAFARVPDDEDQVCFAVDIIDYIPCVASALVCTSVAFPVPWVGRVFGHESFDVFRVDMSRVDTRRWTKILPDLSHKLAKGIIRDGRFASGTTV
jgi:hypothetical protein